jgi:hypothetical protein
VIRGSERQNTITVECFFIRSLCLLHDHHHQKLGIYGVKMDELMRWESE